MLRATGRYADAWLPDLSFHPDEYASGLEVVRTAASDAGRDPLSILPAHLSYIITARRADDIEEALSSPATKSLALLAPAHVWSRHGVQHPLGSNFSGLQDLVPHAMDAETVLSAVTNVPPSLLRDMCLIGTPEDVIDQVAEWRATGLRYVVAINASVIQQSLRKAVESTTPFLKILRGLRKL